MPCRRHSWCCRPALCEECAVLLRAADRNVFILLLWSNVTIIRLQSYWQIHLNRSSGKCRIIQHFCSSTKGISALNIQFCQLRTLACVDRASRQKSFFLPSVCQNTFQSGLAISAARCNCATTDQVWQLRYTQKWEFLKHMKVFFTGCCNNCAIIASVKDICHVEIHGFPSRHLQLWDRPAPPHFCRQANKRNAGKLRHRLCRFLTSLTPFCKQALQSYYSFK